MRAKSLPEARLPDHSKCPPLRNSVAVETLKNIDQFELSQKKRLSIPFDDGTEVLATANNNVFTSTVGADVSIIHFGTKLFANSITFVLSETQDSMHFIKMLRSTLCDSVPCMYMCTLEYYFTVHIAAPGLRAL